MKALSLATRQRGIVAVMAVIFLITAVIFVLTQALNISGTTSIDNKQQMDSTAAMFLAESGLERGMQRISSSVINDAACSGSAGGPYTLGSGSFTLTAKSCDITGLCTGDSGYAGCDSGNPLATACGSCVVTSRGSVISGGVESASRTIQRTINLTTQNGKGCNTAGGNDCSNPVLNLTNNNPYKSVAVFNLGYNRQGQSIFGGCTALGCALQWLVRAKQTSAVMGNSVTIAAGSSYPILTTLQSTNYAYVGALFPGQSTNGPTILGSYWDQETSGNGNTIGKSGTNYGYVNNGVTDSAIASSSIGPVDANGTTQTSTKWCYGGDTLIWGFAGTGASTSDHVSNVSFNTSGSPAQGVALTQVARYPLVGATDVPPTQDIYSQIFYARNPNFSDKEVVTAGNFIANEGYVITAPGSTNFVAIGAASNAVNTAFVASGSGSGTGTARPLNPFALNASSYKGNGTGAIGGQATGSIGANIASASIANNSTSFIVASYTSGTLQDGDILVSSGCSGLAVGSRVLSHSGSTYTLDTQATNGTCSNKAFTFKSNKLTVTAVSSGALYPTDVISGGSIAAGTSIDTWGTATGGIGTYNLTGPAQGPTGGIASITVNSTILHVTACTICDFETGDALSGLISGRTINSAQVTTPAVAGEATGGIGRYPISGVPTRVASANTLRAGTPGATIYLPSNQSKPIENNTRVAVVSGDGSFAANTRATATVSVNGATNSFTVSPIPTATLDVAKICGGTCAFFNNPSSAASTTSFTFNTTNSNYWSSAFMCLKGVDVTPPTQVISSKISAGAWSEIVN